MELKLDDEQLKRLLSEAVLAQMDAAGRDTLIKSALEHLLAKPPKRDGYYDSSRDERSPIEEAFYDSARRVGAEMIDELVRSDERIRKKIHDTVAASVELFVTNAHNDIVQGMAHALEQGMRKALEDERNFRREQED